jgi:hypothetical protein
MAVRAIAHADDIVDVATHADEAVALADEAVAAADEVLANLPQRPPDSPVYSVGFEAQLQPRTHYPGGSDGRHFAEANRQLHGAMQSDTAFAQGLEREFPGVTQGVSPGPRGAYSRQAPSPDVTWHHHPDREGVLQLVPRAQHRAPGAVQNSLHPNGQGGMENWGGGRPR